MGRKKMAPNDQGEIIENLKKKEFNAVWEKVRLVGFKEVPEINTRFIIFNKAAQNFDPNINNNFIMFYKNYLGYFLKNNANLGYYKLTGNSAIIGHMQSIACSPEEEVPVLVKELLSFEG